MNKIQVIIPLEYHSYIHHTSEHISYKTKSLADYFLGSIINIIEGELPNMLLSDLPARCSVCYHVPRLQYRSHMYLGQNWHRTATGPGVFDQLEILNLISSGQQANRCL